MQSLEPVLEPIQSTSLTDQAYERIKQLILSGRLSNGEHLPVDRLSSQLKISRTPVREALLRLEREHLVIAVPYKGTYVTGLNTREVEDIFQVRFVVDTSRAIGNCTTLS
jgi:DNA-binding GntR family transcriptional regulator